MQISRNKWVSQPGNWFLTQLNGSLQNAGYVADQDLVVSSACFFWVAPDETLNTGKSLINFGYRHGVGTDCLKWAWDTVNNQSLKPTPTTKQTELTTPSRSMKTSRLMLMGCTDHLTMGHLIEFEHHFAELLFFSEINVWKVSSVISELHIHLFRTDFTWQKIFLIFSLWKERCIWQVGNPTILSNTWNI